MFKPVCVALVLREQVGEYQENFMKVRVKKPAMGNERTAAVRG